ncbi:MSCRAMM family protein, partial [Brochothrix thermosphacta]|uniref:MSCRAMM family protein n=1 Tax=Brochothrix thermosphacta TaxID=2756 RepID=UPI001600C342
QLVETKAPTGYELDSTPIKVEVKKGQTEAVQVSMTNELTKGGFVLTKTDDKTGDALQGAVFELQDTDGKVLQSGLTTDASGKIAVSELTPGNYQLVETKAPTGYELDSTPIKFEVEKGQTEAVQVSMTNELTKGGFVLTKTDEKTGEALQGAVFELQDTDGKVLQSGLTTDASGKIAVSDLTPGNYQLVETKAPTGYELDATPIKFEVEKGQTEAVQVSMTNTLTKGGFVLTKTDDKTGEALQGAVFELQDTDGKVLQSGLTTDASGKIAVSDLTPGNYQLVETKAPTGYELDSTPI